MSKRKRWNYEDIKKYRKWFKGQKTGTANKNARKLKDFCDWIDKSPETLLKEYEASTNKKAWQRDRKKEVEAFYNHLIAKGYKINSARTTPLGILSFYTRNCETIRDATKIFAPPQIPEDDLIFSQEILRKAYYYSDLEGQTMLSLATCLGYSSADFLALEYEKLRNLVHEADDKGINFIQFIGKSRTKTSIQPRSHLTPEAIHNLKDYLLLLEKKYKKLPKFLFCNDHPDKHITNEELNKRLRRILKNANIETYGKKVRFHLFRKFLYSNLQAKNRDIAKLITAKKVSASDLTYIPNLNAECLRVFKETYKQISLNGDLTGKTKQKQEQRIKQLEEAIFNVNKELQNSKTVSEVLTKKTTELEKKLTENNASMELFTEIIETIQPFIDYVKVSENPKQILDMIIKLVEEVGKN